MNEETMLRLKSFLSRKFIVFAIATAALFLGKLDATIWAGVAATYMAINATQKFVTKEKV